MRLPTPCRSNKTRGLRVLVRRGSCTAGHRHVTRTQYNYFTKTLKLTELYKLF